MKTSNLKKAALVALASTVFAVAPASAQSNSTYDQLNPDLILFFQQFGGTQTVMVNLGIARAYRDATANIMNIVNIGGTLSGSTGSGGAGYGATWYDDTRLASDGTTVLPLTYWGIAAVRSIRNPTALQSTATGIGRFTPRRATSTAFPMELRAPPWPPLAPMG